MDDGRDRDGLDISSLLGFLRRRGLIVLLPLIVGAVAGYVISSGKPESYDGDATLLLSGNQSNQQQQDDFSPGVPDSSEDRESQVTADPVRADAVDRLARRYGRAEAREVVDGATATSGEDSGSVNITTSSGNPRLAAAAANALGTAAIAARRQSTLQRARRALRAAERDLPPPGQRVTPADFAAAQRAQVVRQAVATADGDAELVTRATPASEPSSPKPQRDAIVGGFAGLLLGFVLAMIREQLDRRVRGSQELEDRFGMPVLAQVPRSRGLGKSGGQPLDELRPADAEAFQMLRANLRFQSSDEELRSVVVTSPGQGDGKSTVSMNLAKADAAVGKKVLLIEADLRRPRLGQALGIDGDVGLAAYLGDPGIDLVSVTRRVPVASRRNGSKSGPLAMDVVVAGRVPENPSELVNSERMSNLVREAEKAYDLVVIDTSPVGLVADAIPLIDQASGVVIVGKVGRITSSEAAKLREQLDRIDATTFGLVANFSGDAEGYGYY